MKDTVTLNDWSSLEVFGIRSLSRERCAYSLRVVCDLNEDGRRLVSQLLDVEEGAFAPQWNSTVGGKPAVASVMLPVGIFNDLATFASFEAGALAVIDGFGQLIAIFDQDRMRQYEDAAKGSLEVTIRRNPATGSLAPRVGSFNVHMATGRA